MRRRTVFVHTNFLGGVFFPVLKRFGRRALNATSIAPLADYIAKIA
jgi:hypothetical protein